MELSHNEVYTAAHRLHDRMRTWDTSHIDARGRLADILLIELIAGHSPIFVPSDPARVAQAVVISETLARFVAQWACRYDTLTQRIDQAHTALVTALGGFVDTTGAYRLEGDILITEPAIETMIRAVIEQ